MYFKLVSNDTGWGGSWPYGNYANRRYHFMKDLQGVINGTITSVSGLNTGEAVFNTSASVITGSAPSNNVYIQRNHNNNSNATNSDQYFTIEKRHHGYLEDSNFTASRRIYCRFFNNWGLSFKMASHGNNTNSVPGPTYGWTENSSTGAAVEYNMIDTPEEIYSIEGVVNDKVFIVAVKRSNVSNAWSFNFAMIDQEYHPSLDMYLYNQNSLHCPTVCFSTAEYNLEANNTTGQTNTSTDLKYLYIGKSQTIGQNHAGYNIPNYGFEYRMAGYQHTSTNIGNRPSMHPHPWFEMPMRLPTSNGGNAYMIQPLLYEGSYGTTSTANSHYDYKAFSRLMNFYRTNDDGFYTGERVTDADGNVYRAFRMHKCGGTNTYWSTGADVRRNATYLVPESGTA